MGRHDMTMPLLFLRGLLMLLLLAVVAAGSFLALTWAPDRPVQALLQRWAPPPSTFVTLGGLKVHVRDEGPRDDPAPIVLIHGTSSSLHTWEGWVQALKARRRVITVDLPGFGLTGPNPQGDYRSETYTRFVLDLMDAMGVARFVLGGNCFGGEVAWQVAIAAPRRVRQLILVGATGYPKRPRSIPLGFRIARTPLLNELMTYSLPRRIIEASLRNVYGDPSRITPALIDRYRELTLREGNRAALRRRFEQKNPGAHAAQIRELDVPTLILWGGRDRVTPVEDGHMFNRDIASSRLLVFEDLGHMPQEEDPVRTVAAVQEFLSH